MIKTHKLTLNPNSDQTAWFYQQCGYAKFAYNQALSDFKTELSSDTFLSKNQLSSRFNEKKKHFDWTSSQDQRAAKYAIDHLGCAVDNYVAKRAGFPKFKKRGCKHSYQTDEQSVKFDGKRIKLPKIGWVKTFETLRFVGRIVSVTISRTAHRWFASVSVEVADTEVVDMSTHPTIGIDVGINTLATLDDGTKFENRKPLKRFERKLKREQRKLSRKVFLSQNWYKQKRVVERINYRVACIRRDAHHKATTDIVRRASKIGIETLSVRNLLKNRKLSRSLSDAALGGFLEKLRTKALSLGIPIVQADRFFASSKMCSSCGHKKEDLTLSDREYQCSNCGYCEDRDVNAAINLRNLAAGYAES